MQDNMASGNYGNSGGSECNESYAAAKEAYMSLVCLSVSKPVSVHSPWHSRLKLLADIRSL